MTSDAETVDVTGLWFVHVGQYSVVLGRAEDARAPDGKLVLCITDCAVKHEIDCALPPVPYKQISDGTGGRMFFPSEGDARSFFERRKEELLGKGGP